MKRVLIAGVGNILLGDDGVGPYVVRKLAANYVFEEGVELEDLGTPALDFVDHIVGLDVLIVVDAVNNGEAPGTVTRYSKADLLQHAPSVRMDTHSPALLESLMMAELYGSGPKSSTLVGVAGESYGAECRLSPKVEAAVEEAIRSVLRVLDQLDIGFVRRFEEPEAGIWWSSDQKCECA
jgi:hydrogenase maturation protease